MIYKVEMPLGGLTLSIEAGRVARQADGSVLVQYGESVILATVVAAEDSGVERDFFPLTVEYRERYYAAGKIPGGFIKREGRPKDTEILGARLIDRTIRPLFPDGYSSEVQVMVTVLSSDQENDTDVLGIIGASAALTISDIPFMRPVAGVRVGLVDGEYVINPTFSTLDSSKMDIVVSSTDDSIVMVEGGADEVSEDVLLDGIKKAHVQSRKIVALISELASKCGREKKILKAVELDTELQSKVKDLAQPRIAEVFSAPRKSKEALEEAISSTRSEVKENLAEEFPESERAINRIIDDIEKKEMRSMILEKNVRADGRGLDEIRPITCEIGILPRTHGSALFTRGQTQSLVITTLGTSMDEQRMDELEGESRKSYMLHYNFPPYSVGEVRMIRIPSRREIGHGALAERAIKSVIPEDSVFPYTVRIVSDILESNGSSSMATVCGGSLSLMDAGVPIKSAVAGIAMGLIKEDDKVAILTDILGIEDHLGDMDFKVAGTKHGISAFQMDIKTGGITFDIMKLALEKAKKAREFILETMNKAISEPRKELSKYAPRILTLTIDVDRIGTVIGPGGKTIRRITEESGARIEIEDDGTVLISSVDKEAGEKAYTMVQELVQEPEVGKIYEGTVKGTTKFGAFVEVLPGIEGLLHISEIDTERIARVEDVLRRGDKVKVKIIGIDEQNKIRLSRKVLL